MTLDITLFPSIHDHIAKTLGPDRVLDGLLFKLLYHKPHEADRWSDLVGEDDVWHLRDAHDNIAFSPPPAYSGSSDIALDLKQLLYPDYPLTIQERITDQGREFIADIHIPSRPKESPFQTLAAPTIPLAILKAITSILFLHLDGIFSLSLPTPE